MNPINEIVKYFDDSLRNAFSEIDEIILSKITEIRIRKNRPIVIIIRNTAYFIDYNGDLYDYPPHNAVRIDSQQFDKLFLSLCDYSIYSSMENMKNGFITLESGSRIGIASTCVFKNKGINAVKDITSLNIRIHKEVVSCADSILNSLYVNSFPSIIVAGAPNSGKTTLLRDLSYQLSNGFNNHYPKIAVVDERNEIAGKQNDNYCMSVGVNCDVLTGFTKAKGIEIATRVLSPNMIVCDEIATLDEVESIEYAFSSGITFALSVHLSDKEDLVNKPIMKKLLKTNEFSYIVLLKNHTYETQIIDAGEVLNEINRNDNLNYILNSGRDSTILKSKTKM